MKLIFAHDEKLTKYGDKYYSSTNLIDVINNRYLKYFDEVVLLVRVVENNNYNIKKGKVIDTNKVKVISVPDPNNLSVRNYKKIIEVLKGQILGDNILLVRLPSMIGSIAVEVARKNNKKYITEVVGCAFDALWNHGSMKGKIMAPIMYIVTKRDVKSAQNVLYVTNEFLQKRYPTNGEGIGCSDVEIVISEESINSKLKNIPNKKNVQIGMIGTLDTKYKGHDTAFKAIKLLKEKGYNITLNLIGVGELKNWQPLIDRLGLNQNIKFLGTISSGEEVFSFLDSIDLYIQPSLTEGMPRATIEAMSRGCPIVTTNVGGFRELTHEDFRIRKNDYKNLASKIECLINDKQIYIEQVKYNYEKSKKFLKSELVKRQKQFYSNS